MKSSEEILGEVKNVIISSVAGEMKPENLSNDFQLVNNILDSMAVTNLIVALEEYFGFLFNDDELSAEVFETVGSLTDFIAQKINKNEAY